VKWGIFAKKSYTLSKKEKEEKTIELTDFIKK
jgi:hypothetical protein